MNAVEIEEAVSKLAAEPFDPKTFPFAFLEAFGNKATTISRLKSGASNASDVEGGVLQRNNIHMAIAEAGAVIYDNGTESDVLLRSQQRALHRDSAGRHITDPSAGPLFADRAGDGTRKAGRSMCCAVFPVSLRSPRTAT